MINKYYNYDNKMNSKNKFVYLDRLTKSINPIHHKLINEIFSTDSLTVIYNELLPSLPADVLRNLYINIHDNLYLFTPEQIEKLKPIGNFYANIKFPCSTQCDPVNNPDRSPLQDKEYATKKECRSKCDKKISTLDTFLSLKDKLQYLISINKKELISTIQEKDIYNTDNIIVYDSPLYKQFRPYVITAEESEYNKNPSEYKNVKYLYKRTETYDAIYGKETITRLDTEGDDLVFKGRPLTEKQTTHLRKLSTSSLSDSLADRLSKLTQLKELVINRSFFKGSLSKLTQLEKLILGGPRGLYFNQPLGDSLSKLTQLKELFLGVKSSDGSFNQPLGDSLSNLTQLIILSIGTNFNQPLGYSLSKLKELKELNLSVYNQPLGDSLSNLTHLEKLNLGSKFNQKLGDSLSKLTQLKELGLAVYTHPIGDSLSKLTQLEKLILASYTQPLGDSLSKLTQLKILNLRSYMEPFVDSLSKLTQLEELDIHPENANIRNPTNFNIWLKQLKQLKVVRYGGREQIYNGGPSFSFTRKNSVKKELRDVDFKSKKSSKRRSPRKPPKRRSPRKSSKRRSPRKSSKRRSPRKSSKQRSPRKSSKRRSPRKSPKRRSPRN